MSHVDNSLLGKDTVYDQPYDAGLLFPIPRAENRAKLDDLEGLSVCGKVMSGEDVWTCYELSWLASGGKPQVGIAEFRIPCDSPYMIESKSFKLYLNSINHKVFDSEDSLVALLESDLSNAAGAPISVEIVSSREPLNLPRVEGICVDDVDAKDFVYQPDSSLLRVSEESVANQVLFSELLRSNCPVTGQPDWGTVYIEYTGKRIELESFLRYVVSFRQCQDFHEHCVERMFVDLLDQCHCEELTVYARYTRRGGLDINPFRTTKKGKRAPNWRTSRQ